MSTQMTVHSCTEEGYYRCEGVACGDNNGNASDPGDRFKGNCDKNGCDFNPYRVGSTDFYGPGQLTSDQTRDLRMLCTHASILKAARSIHAPQARASSWTRPSRSAS
jgi:hypothetical protein